jgi:5-methylcytosine-specific restriction endonuclease McrA
MTYKEKLQTDDWKIRRIWIIQKDKYTCQTCGKLGSDNFLLLPGIMEGDTLKPFNEPIIVADEESLELNVHHVCYRKGLEPWEYPDEELITLCPECHKKIHEEQDIPIFNETGKIISNTTKCDRCGGYGYIPQYSHIQSGICFKCWGEGIILDVLN